LEIGINELIGGAALLLIQIGLLIANHRRQQQVKAEEELKRKKHEAERQRKDDELRHQMTAALIKINDDTKAEVEELRSRMEEKEVEFKSDLDLRDKRHQQELLARDQREESLLKVIGGLESELKTQLDLSANDREYYRDIINDIRQDAKGLQDVAVKAQEMMDAAIKENKALREQEMTLNLTITGQRTQIDKLLQDLARVTEERDRILLEINALKNLEAENVELKARIELLHGQLQEKDAEIAKLQTEIEGLRKLIPAEAIGALTSAGVRMELEKVTSEQNPTGSAG
jgi:uncharacterized phage infection (PIP) family protein YhgE